MKAGLFQFRTFLVAITLVTGSTGFVCAIVAFAVGVYRATFVDEGPRIYVGFLGNGEPYLNHYIFSQSYRTATDLDGNPIPLENETDFTIQANLPAKLPLADPHERAPWDQRIVGFMDNQQPPNYWYLVQDGLADGHAYFAGYSAANHDRVGYLGLAGYRPDGVPPAEQFPIHAGVNWNVTQVITEGNAFRMAVSPQGFNVPNGPGQFQPWMIYINSGANAYEVNLAKRESRAVLADLPHPVLNMDTGGRGGRTKSQSWIAMRTAVDIHFYYPDGQQKTIPLDSALQGRDLRLGERPDGSFTVVAVKDADYAAGRTDVQIYTMAEDGTLGPPRETFETGSGFFDPFPYEAPLVTGSPVMLSVCLAEFRTRQLLRYARAETWGEALSMAFRQFALYLLATLIAGAVLAVLCYRRQTRYQSSLGQLIFWSLFVFLFGIPGWIGYRYCRRWPPLDVCPLCHELAPHDQEICAVCGRVFPQPELKGTEIFA